MNHCTNVFTKVYLVDNRPMSELPLPPKDIANDDWSLVKNQIFLGLLGSAVIPRKEVEPLINDVTAAGIRFVYFSPRNMRRTKELASQMGIDVAWWVFRCFMPIFGSPAKHMRHLIKLVFLYVCLFF